MDNRNESSREPSARQSALRPEGYRPRVLDERLTKLLNSFGGVEITGAKWCGKTWMALAQANSVDRLDEKATFEAAALDPNLVLEGPAPHLVDEWQEVPEVWDAARRMIDKTGNEKGLLLLTGSSKPKSTGSLPTGTGIHHSGTGRIARMRLRPMTLFETGDSTGAVSLARLFEGEFEPTRRATEVSEIARWCCRGGWPSLLGLADEFALETPPAYLQSILEVSVPELGKSGATMHRLMKALALNLAQAATYKTLALDMALGDEDRSPSEATVDSYLELLKDLYLVEELTGWEPPLVSKRRVRTKPKRYFVDPSLPAALLGASPAALLKDTQTLGKLFETLSVRDLRVYLSRLEGARNQLNYYLDDKNLEVDAVIQLSDGRWAAIEIKLGDAKCDEGAAHLLALQRKVLANPAAQTKPPEFLMVVVGKGELAYRRADGVLVVPLATLGP